MELITAVLLSLAVTAGFPEVTADDLALFPPRDAIRQQWEAAQAHARWVEVQISLTGMSQVEAWGPIWKDAEYRCHCWDLLRQAAQDADCGYTWGNAWYLDRLRYQIGEYAFRHGAMPNAVPAWRMRE